MKDKIEELNSFVLDASVQTWKPVVDSGYDSVEGVYFRWLFVFDPNNGFKYSVKTHGL